MTDTPVTADVDTLAGAVRVTARDVRVGDCVFSTTGQPDRVIRVSSPRNKRRVTITPENLWPLVLAPDETLTVRRLVCPDCTSRNITDTGEVDGMVGCIDCGAAWVPTKGSADG